ELKWAQPIDITKPWKWRGSFRSYCLINALVENGYLVAAPYMIGRCSTNKDKVRKEVAGCADLLAQLFATLCHGKVMMRDILTVVKDSHLLLLIPSLNVIPWGDQFILKDILCQKSTWW